MTHTFVKINQILNSCLWMGWNLKKPFWINIKIFQTYWLVRYEILWNICVVEVAVWVYIKISLRYLKHIGLKLFMVAAAWWRREDRGSKHKQGRGDWLEKKKYAGEVTKNIWFEVNMEKKCFFIFLKQSRWDWFWKFYGNENFWDVADVLGFENIQKKIWVQKIWGWNWFVSLQQWISATLQIHCTLLYICPWMPLLQSDGLSFIESKQMLIWNMTSWCFRLWLYETVTGYSRDCLEISLMMN